MFLTLKTLTMQEDERYQNSEGKYENEAKDFQNE